MCFGSREKGDEAGAARSRELDKIIRADEKKMAKEVKLLLLGMFCSTWARQKADSRCWNRSGRVGQVNSPEADEAYLRVRFQQEREAGVEAGHFRQHCPVFPPDF